MIRVWLFAFAFLSLEAGCCLPRSEAPNWSGLYKRCVGPASFIGQGGYLYADFVFTSDCDKARFAKRIKRGLISGIDSTEWPYDELVVLSPPITEQEFWALVYADLTHCEFVIQMAASDAEREERVRRFVANIESR